VAPNEDLSQELMKLVGMLRRRLMGLEEELEVRAKQKQEIEILKAGRPKEIYLHARQEHQAFWANASKELSNVGIGVRPGQPEPDNVEENERIWIDLAKVASRCEAMLLIGADPFALDADLDLIGRDRREYIRSRHRKFLPCAVLDKAGLRTDDRFRAARRRGIDWLDGTATGWSSELFMWLKQAAARAADSYGVTS
jgi:hypothetical protein